MPNVGGPATVITRRQNPILYSAGSKYISQLTRGLCYREMYIRLTATPTLAGASNTAANTKLGDEWGVVTKIELIANGTTVLFSCAGSDLRPISRILKGGISPKVSTNLGDGATANPVLDSTVVMPFLNPRSTRPFDTLLYTGEMSDLRLEVTWATDWTSINSAATAWTTQPAMEIYTREQTLPVYPAGTPQAGQPMLPFFYRRMLKVPVTIAAANSAFRYQLNTGPIYRGLIINGLNATPAEATGTFTNLKVFSGPTTFMDMSEPVIYSAHNWKARIPYEQIQGAAGYTQEHGDISASRVIGAWYWMDFADDGFMTESLDTDSIGDTYVEFNTPAAANPVIFTQELLRINRGGVGNVSPSV